MSEGTFSHVAALMSMRGKDHVHETQLSHIGLDKGGYPANMILISPRKHMLWYSLEAPRRGASNEYPQHMFLWRNKENINTF